VVRSRVGLGCVTPWLVVLGCGRIGFDPKSQGGATCLEDGFGTGSAGWEAIRGAWNVEPTDGPDGSPALNTPDAGFSLVRPPGLAAITSLDLQFDFLINGAMYGDFGVYLAEQGMVPGTAPGPFYVIGLHPVGSDSGIDAIITFGAAIAQRPTSVAASTWHHLEVVRASDGTIDVDLDDAPYLQTPGDDAITGPLDVYFGFYYGGTLDNILAACTQ
jgi:hypothetical protein